MAEQEKLSATKMLLISANEQLLDHKVCLPRISPRPSRSDPSSALRGQHAFDSIIMMTRQRALLISLR